MRPSLCYIAPPRDVRPAEAGHVDRIVGPARELDFPDGYVQRLLEFRPA